jgi:hypothetical protein
MARFFEVQEQEDVDGEQQPRGGDFLRNDPVAQQRHEQRAHDAHGQHEHRGLGDVGRHALGRARDEIVEIRGQREAAERGDQHRGRHELPVTAVLDDVEQPDEEEGAQEPQGLIEQARGREHRASRDERTHEGKTPSADW